MDTPEQDTPEQDPPEQDPPEQDPPEQGYPVSELAEAFRGPTPLEYKTLKDDIELNGQQVPISIQGREDR